MQLPQEGRYTFKIKSPGFSAFQKKIHVQNSQTLDFYLSPTVLRTRSLKVRGRKQIQRLSRNTLIQQELKRVPATFGDSLNALNTLPGVTRSIPGGFLGPLIIRGGNKFSNRFYIDGIPVLYPQHFGALQSVISNELMERIDLYSSSFPSSFGDSLGGVIDISTKDDVKGFNSKLIVSLISSDFYFENTVRGFPIRSNKEETETDQKTRGYWIASGRISYLTLTIDPILQATIDDTSVAVDELKLPQYYDYQLKGKYFLDDKDNHSVNLLFFGFYDTLKVIRERGVGRFDDFDPLLTESFFRFRNSIFSNNLGLYYRYRPSVKINNQLTLFSGLNDSHFLAEIPTFEDIGPREEDIINSGNSSDNKINARIKPNLFGIKNFLEWSWLPNYAYLKFGLEVIVYHFSSEGVSQTSTRDIPEGLIPELGDLSSFRAVDINFVKTNIVYSSFLENTFEYFNFKFVPGLRASFLQFTQTAVYDPRFLLNYEFDWDMLVSGSYGLYSSFPQTNYFLFNQPFDQQPDIVRSASIKPERARHMAAGVEQKFALFTLKVEGFYNVFVNQLIRNPGAREGAVYINRANARAKGVEVFLRLDRQEGKSAFYGWVSYTFTRSERRTNLTLTEHGNDYLSTSLEQPHALKMILGYIWGKNELSSRFELNSGFPYTPIVGDTYRDFPIDRYSPVYSQPYSDRFPMSHRLDIRYTRTSVFSWGSIDWYIELINVYDHRPASQQGWSYTHPYEKSSNPKFISTLSVLRFPNFGVEVRF